jgi:hypothetical protein
MMLATKDSSRGANNDNVADSRPSKMSPTVGLNQLSPSSPQRAHAAVHGSSTTGKNATRAPLLHQDQLSYPNRQVVAAFPDHRRNVLAANSIPYFAATSTMYDKYPAAAQQELLALLENMQELDPG